MIKVFDTIQGLGFYLLLTFFGLMYLDIFVVEEYKNRVQAFLTCIGIGGLLLFSVGYLGKEYFK